MRNVDLRELALKKVKITGKVIGKFGTFEIEQMYKNNTKEVLEVGYTFPIVETATVVGFEIKVGDKIFYVKIKRTFLFKLSWTKVPENIGIAKEENKKWRNTILKMNCGEDKNGKNEIYEYRDW